MTQFVDWDLAAAMARRLGGAGPNIGLERAMEVVALLRDDVDTAASHVADFTGLRVMEPTPVRIVDRADWATANVTGLSSVLDPLAQQVSGDPSAATRVLGSRVAGAQAGVVLGYLSSKVLGQFEIFGDHAGQLLMVAPNIVEVERQLDVDAADFRMWISLHEATHAAQFGAVSWLRDHFHAEIAAFGEASAEDGDGLVERSRRALGVLADSIRDTDTNPSVVDLVTSPGQREVVDRLTALMTLLEGHADYVMDAVGPEVVSSVATIRERFDKRRHGGGPMQRLARRMLGVDVKLRQYTQGKTFVETVVDTAGPEGFNRVWESADNLPNREEIDAPEQWVERVAG